MQKGLFVAIAGPSGVGKGTIIKLLKEKFTQAVFILSHTTRQMRLGEKEGEVYYFVNEEEFKKGIEEGAFLEWAKVHQGAYYGFKKEPVMEALQANKLVIREMDVQGIRKVKQVISPAQLVTIFVKPESLDVLMEHIKKRGELPEEELKRRMESARVEMAAAGEFDYQVINYEGKVEKCAGEVEKIVREELENVM